MLLELLRVHTNVPVILHIFRIELHLPPQRSLLFDLAYRVEDAHDSSTVLFLVLNDRAAVSSIVLILLDRVLNISIVVIGVAQVWIFICGGLLKVHIDALVELFVLHDIKRWDLQLLNFVRGFLFLIHELLNLDNLTEDVVRFIRDQQLVSLAWTLLRLIGNL